MGDFKLNYRKFHIYYDPPPIPVRDFDWSATHDNYDPGDPEIDPQGIYDKVLYGKTKADVMLEINDWYEEHADEL